MAGLQTFTGPDGKDYDFPADMPPEAIKDVFRKKFGGPVSTAGDMAKSFGAGVGKGAIGIAGLGGDIESLITKYVPLPSDETINDAVSGLGADPNGVIGRMARSALGSGGPQLPTTAEIQSAVEDNVTGKFYEPQTTAGKYAGTVGEFVPGLLTGGTEGLVQGGVKALGKRALLDVVAPAVGSEAAGQLTEGSVAEPYARVLGAVLGGGAGKVGEILTSPKTPAVTFDTIGAKAAAAESKAGDIKTLAQDAYKAADDAGVVIGPAGMKTTFDAMKSKVLTDTGLPAVNKVFADKFPNIKANIAVLDDVAKGPTSLMGLDKLRQTLRSIPATASDAEQRYATMMVKGLDDYVGNLTPADVLTSKGATKEATDALVQARKLYRDSSVLQDKTKIIGDVMEKAQDAKGANFTDTDMNTAVRQQFRGLREKMRKNDDIKDLFSGDEQQLIEDIVRGTASENRMRYWSKFVPEKLLNTGLVGSVGASYLGGPLGIAGTVVTAGAKVGQALARHGAETSQKRTLNSLLDTVLNDGKALPKKVAPYSPPFKKRLLDAITFGSTDSRTGN